MVSQDSTKHQPVRVDTAKELGETDPYWWFARAKSSVIKWRREYAPDEGDACTAVEVKQSAQWPILLKGEQKRTMATDRTRTVAKSGLRNTPQRMLTAISKQSSIRHMTMNKY